MCCQEFCQNLQELNFQVDRMSPDDVEVPGKWCVEAWFYSSVLGRGEKTDGDTPKNTQSFIVFFVVSGCF